MKVAAAALALALLPGTTLGAEGTLRPGGEERSVVRIVNYSQRADWSLPWQAGSVRVSSGSGVRIEGGQILTNAHVVSDSRLLLVFLHGDPDPHEAEVLEVAHDCDLALVGLREPGLLDSVPALGIGGLPGLGSVVDTLGYPAGGTQISLTRGVVSRVEAGPYLHSGIDQHLIGQTDAAINPGNSGGPVVQEGRIVGIAFQAAQNLDNVGFFIPSEVIRRFLHDVADGRYDGYPDLSIETSSLENPAARRRAGMREDESGVRVDLVYSGGSSEGRLLEGDVLLAIAGQRIANDGSVAIEDLGGLRTPFGLLADRLQAGETVRLDVLRGGERTAVDIPVRVLGAVRSQGHSYERPPRFFVYGGLLFMPLDRELLETAGEDWFANADRELLAEFMVRPTEDPAAFSRERVVLVRRLDHPVNADLAWHRLQIVDRVNGRTIGRLEDLVEAIESNRDPFHLLEFAAFSRFGVLDREEADRANREILERYRVPADRNL